MDKMNLRNLMTSRQTSNINNSKTHSEIKYCNILLAWYVVVIIIY